MKRTSLVQHRPSSVKSTFPRHQLRVEQLETRCLMSVSEVRSISGLGNNLLDLTQGTAGQALIRISPAAYRVTAADPGGFFTPSMNGGSPFFVAGSRLVSNFAMSQATELFGPVDINTVNSNGLTAFGYTWGQFIDHDMGLTPDTPVNDFPIPADPNHPDDPIASLRMGRSVFDPTTGITSPRDQINVNSAYLDLSQVYGSTDDLAEALRTFSKGKMKTSAGKDGKIGTKDDLLPYNNLNYFTADQLLIIHMANDAHIVPTEQLFVAGDVRANETTELTSLQTLFVRNHNQLASKFAKAHKTWTDEQVYQAARKVNIAQAQIITFTQYLPALLGPSAMPGYTGYDETVDASIANEFSTVAFRFGHSLLNNEVPRHDKNGEDVDGKLNLAESFFNPTLLKAGGVLDPVTGHYSTDIGAVLKGDADITAQENDLLAVSSIRNLLFGPPGLGFGEDLMARDMWRAHDHGIGTYNQLRIAYGLDPITDTPGTHGFEQISADPAVQQLLFGAYADPAIRPTFLPGVDGILGTADDKHAGDIDPFAAGLAEDHAPGSNMGPLFTRMLADQFDRLRGGDRFWWANLSWNAEELVRLAQGVTLGQIIKSNTDVKNIQLNVFEFSASISGKITISPTRHLPTPPLSGITVQLKDGAGNVIATTLTDSLGRYSFNHLSGPAADPVNASGVSRTGTYTVEAVLPANLQLKKGPKPIKLISGDDTETKADFTLKVVDVLAPS